MSEPNEDEQAADMASRTAAASRIDEAITEVESQAQLAEQIGDTKSSASLRAKLPGLRRKREEIMRGERA